MDKADVSSMKHATRLWRLWR